MHLFILFFSVCCVSSSFFLWAIGWTCFILLRLFMYESTITFYYSDSEHTFTHALVCDLRACPETTFRWCGGFGFWLHGTQKLKHKAITSWMVDRIYALLWIAVTWEADTEDRHTHTHILALVRTPQTILWHANTSTATKHSLTHSYAHAHTNQMQWPFRCRRIVYPIVLGNNKFLNWKWLCKGPLYCYN